MPADAVVPGWLRWVMLADRAGSSWYVGTGFLFAPILAVVSPWPMLTTVLWWLIALAGLELGLLGIAMAVGLAQILRSGEEIPEDYWFGLVGQRVPETARSGTCAGGARRDDLKAERSGPDIGSPIAGSRGVGVPAR